MLTLPGGPALIIHPQHPTGALVIYFHGAGEDQASIETAADKAPMIADLLNDGYTVAAADAYGDNWGSPRSAEDYVQLQQEAHPTAGTYLLIQSMGGLDGLPAVDTLTDVKAAAAIFPACHLSTMVGGRFGPDIEKAYGGTAPAGDALSVSTHVTGLPMAFWASAYDRTVDAATNAVVCAAAERKLGAVVTFHHTIGDHGDSSNFDPEAVLRLFGSAQ